MYFGPIQGRSFTSVVMWCVGVCAYVRICVCIRICLLYVRMCAYVCVCARVCVRVHAYACSIHDNTFPTDFLLHIEYFIFAVTKYMLVLGMRCMFLYSVESMSAASDIFLVKFNCTK